MVRRLVGVDTRLGAAQVVPSHLFKQQAPA